MYNQQAAQAYQKTSQQSVDPRSLEAQVLVKAATRMQGIVADWDNLPIPSNELEDALTYNRKLWTVLIGGIKRDDNPLPDNIKSNLLNIASFIFKHTMTTLANPTPQRMETLININKNIAEGLRGNA